MDMKKRYEEVATETRGKFKVGADPRLFLEEHLPWNKPTPQGYRDWKSSQRRVTSLQEMAKDFGGATGHKRKHNQLKPEDAMYPCLVGALDGYPLLDIEERTLQPANAIETNFCKYTGTKDFNAGGVGTDVFQYPKEYNSEDQDTSFAAALTHLELKRNASQDCFRDDPFKPSLSADAVFQAETITDEGKHVRGQIAVYAALSMHLTFRCHFFSILVTGNTMRFIRWDRRGAIVTRAFNYGQEFELVFSFYARFAQLDPLQRGLDPNVHPINPTPKDEAGKRILEEARVALKAMSEAVRGTLYLNQYPLTGHTSREVTEGTVVKPSDLLQMTVQLQGQENARELVVYPPEFDWGALSPFSRATRQCLVYDIMEKKVYFMKDYWREDSERTLLEAEIYKILKDKRIPNVADMAIGGDVPDFRTWWQEEQFDFPRTSYPLSFGKKLRKPLLCHRLFFNTIGRNLRTFKTARNLVSCVADAVEALEAAYKVARILHRDVSAGNIMIHSVENKDRGLLLDWDHCILVDFKNGIPRAERTGTWQFMSVRLLDIKNVLPAVHTILDDRESVLWVLLYMTYRYLPHDTDPRQLYKTILEVFNDVHIVGNRVGTSASKGLELKHIARGEQPVKTKIQGLGQLLQQLARVFASQYVDVTDRRRKRFHDAQRSDTEAELWDEFWDVLGSQHVNSDTWLLETLREGAKNIPVPPASGQDFQKNELSPGVNQTPRKSHSYSTRTDLCPFVRVGWTGGSGRVGNGNKRRKSGMTNKDGSPESGYVTGDGASSSVGGVTFSGRTSGMASESSMDVHYEVDEESITQSQP